MESQSIVKPAESVKTKPIKVHMSYKDIHNLCVQIAPTLRELKIDYIIAIGNGGYAVAVILRYLLNVNIIGVSVTSYDDNDVQGDIEVVQFEERTFTNICGKTFLVVDDVRDTGVTLNYIVKRLAQYTDKIYATVAQHKVGKGTPQINSELDSLLKGFYPMQCILDYWVVYPWAVEDYDRHQRLADTKTDFYIWKDPENPEEKSTNEIKQITGRIIRNQNGPEIFDLVDPNKAIVWAVENGMMDGLSDYY